MGTVVAEACVVPCRRGNVGATPHDDAAGHDPDRGPRNLGPGVARRLALTDGPSRISQRMDTVGVRPVGAVLDGWTQGRPAPTARPPAAYGWDSVCPRATRRRMTRAEGVPGRTVVTRRSRGTDPSSWRIRLPDLHVLAPVTVEECACGLAPQAGGRRPAVDRVATVHAAVCRDVRGLRGRVALSPGLSQRARAVGGAARARAWRRHGRAIAHGAARRAHRRRAPGAPRRARGLRRAGRLGDPGLSPGARILAAPGAQPVACRVAGAGHHPGGCPGAGRRLAAARQRPPWV